MRHKFQAAIAATLFAGTVAAIAAPATTPAMGFETPTAWTTAPLELPNLMHQYGVTEEDLWCAQAVKDRTWNVDSTSLKELSGGLKITADQTKEGKTSGLWDNLVRYPTLATADVPHDWSQAKNLSLWIHAAAPTGDVITLGIRSDNPATAGKDFFLYSFRIDWTGWKLVSLPLNAFEAYQKPLGWNKVDAVYFFAKAFGHQPNPYTVLHLDDMTLDRPGVQSVASVPPVPSAAAEKDADGFIYRVLCLDQPLPVPNHSWPEKVEPSASVGPARFISHQTYFRTERDLYKYYPRFNPGFPSFDPAGHAYVYCGDLIQFPGKDGKWQTVELRPILSAWAKKQGWKGMINNWGAQGSDPAIRFDKDGDAYILIQGEQLDAKGNRIHWKKRFAALLHGRNGMKDWNVYMLPGRIASFEKLDGHNQDCLKRPPVILLGDYKHFREADKAGYLLLPVKRTDGTLELPPTVKYADVCIGVNYHSGDGNIALTRGDKIFIVWGWCIDPSATPETVKMLTRDGSDIWKKWKLSILKDTPAAKSLPPIPADHPGLKLSYHYRIHKAHSSEYPEGFSRDGVPTFIVAYDIPTKTVSKPVFIGCGGGAVDGHNWPAITADSKGILHVIINGHHNPCTYTHSLRPDDISAWSAPEYIPDRGGLPTISYSSLNCDRNDTLYTFHRASTDTYNNRLVLYRKKANRPWDTELPIVAPFKRLYTAWYHHITVDVRRNRMFVTYYALSNLTFLSRDMYEFLIFRRPDLEKRLCSGFGKKGDNPGPIPLVKTPVWDSWTHGGQYTPVASELVTLVSDDGGDTWRLAVSNDYTTR